MGVDACKKGWVAVADDLRAYFGRTIRELVAAADEDGPLAVIAVDIPIGLPLHGPRQADALVRALLGKRASSVFTTPVRAALAATTHAEASAITREATGKGLSQQAYALRAKILQVDQWAQVTPHRVVEVHPEVCFEAMAGRTLKYPKSTWAGAEERRVILARAGIVVPAEIGLAGEVAGTDDVFDAAAAMWTAQRVLHGRAVSHPAVPESFGDGHEAAIWV